MPTKQLTKPALPQRLIERALQMARHSTRTKHPEEVAPPMWATSENLDERTGLPLPYLPIYLDISPVYRRTFGGDTGQLIACEATISAYAITSIPGDDITETQIRDAQVIVANARTGHPDIVWSNITKDTHGTPGMVWFTIRLRGPYTEMTPDQFDLLAMSALMPMWIAWHLADPALNSRIRSMPVLGRAVDLVAEGTEWRTALAVAELDGWHPEK